MNPAKRSAKVVGAISVVRSGHSEAKRFATALETTTHILELTAAPEEDATPSTDQSRSPSPEPIEVHTPGELNDRMLRVLFGKWPPR